MQKDGSGEKVRGAAGREIAGDEFPVNFERELTTARTGNASGIEPRLRTLLGKESAGDSAGPAEEILEMHCSRNCPLPAFFL